MFSVTSSQAHKCCSRLLGKGGATEYHREATGALSAAFTTSYPKTRARKDLGTHREQSQESKATEKCRLTDQMPEKPWTPPSRAPLASSPAFPMLEASLGVSDKTAPGS